MKPATGFYCIDCHFQRDELPEPLKIRFHDLRHTAVSRMVTARVPLTTSAKIVGWSKSTLAAMVVRHSQPDIEEIRDAVERISRGTRKIPRKRKGWTSQL